MNLPITYNTTPTLSVTALPASPAHVYAPAGGTQLLWDTSKPMANGQLQINNSQLEMAARELRYNWFAQLATEHHYDRILTAHHLNDNIETLLLNLSRGTGINGLCGIAAANGNIVRPRLSISNEKRLAFEEKYIRNPYVNKEQDIHRQILPGQFIYMSSYLSKRDLGYKFAIEQIDNGELKSKVISEYVEWDTTNNKWKLHNCYVQL